MKDDMAHIAPLQRERGKDFETVFAVTEAVMGFVPNSMLIMARDPGLFAAFQEEESRKPQPVRPLVSSLLRSKDRVLSAWRFS